MGLNATDVDLLMDVNPNFVKLGQMAAKIAAHNFEIRFNTIVVFNLLISVPMQAFLENFGPVLIKRGKFVPKNRVHYVPQFVLFGKQSEELVELLRWMREVKYDNTAKFVVVCASNNYEMCDENILMQNVGDIYISNIVFLKLAQDETPEAYTVYPLKPSKCWNTEPVKMDISYECENDDCYSKLFPEKYSNLYGCPFIVSTYEQDPFMIFHNESDGSITLRGGDGNILNLLISMLNATLVIKSPEEEEWGHFDKGNWTGCLGDIYNHRAQGAMCAVPLTVNKYGNFQISFTYDSMDMIWAAPMPTLKPSWEKLLHPLPRFLRIATLSMFFAIVLLNTLSKTKLWRNITKVLNTNPAKDNLLVYSWTLFLGLPVLRLPRKSMFRLVVYTWIWYALIVRSLYQATLVSSLKLRNYEDKFENISDVMSKKLPFGGPASLREYYYDDRAIYDNWYHVEQDAADAMLDKISSGEMEFVIAANRETVVAHVVKYHGIKNVQILPDKIVNSPTVIYFKHYSHMCSPVSKLLTTYVEGGFTQRFYAQYKDHLKRLQPRSSDEAQTMTLVHFSGLFLLLSAGAFLGVIFFIIEVACGKYKRC